MFEHLGHHSSIIHIQQHKVRLRRKPALLLAVFYLSGFLTSCGRLDMEGYTPRGNDIASHKEIHENTGIIPGLNKPVEALEQEPGSNPVETPNLQNGLNLREHRNLRTRRLIHLNILRSLSLLVLLYLQRHRNLYRPRSLSPRKLRLLHLLLMNRLRQLSPNRKRAS